MLLYSIGQKTCAEAKIFTVTSKSCSYINKGGIYVKFFVIFFTEYVRRGRGDKMKQFRSTLRQLHTFKNHPNFVQSSFLENGAQGQGKKIHAIEN